MEIRQSGQQFGGTLLRHAPVLIGCSAGKAPQGGKFGRSWKADQFAAEFESVSRCQGLGLFGKPEARCRLGCGDLLDASLHLCQAKGYHELPARRAHDTPRIASASKDQDVSTGLSS